jgi:Arc/MetJ family transcription regulator
MKMTIDVDRKLLAAAKKASGIKLKSDVVIEGLHLIVRREAARKLMEMGGTMPGLKPFVRRRRMS